MAIYIYFSYLTKQGARGGKEVDLKSFSILWYSSWAVISL